MTKVTLTLRPSTAKKLQAICHKRHETASDVVDRWVLQVDLDGNLKASDKPDTIDSLMRAVGLK